MDDLSNLGWCKSSGNRKNLRERERERDVSLDHVTWVSSDYASFFCLRHKFLNVLVDSPHLPVSFVNLLLFKSQFVRQIHCWRFLHSWWTPRPVVYLKHGVRDNSPFCCFFLKEAINLHLKFQIIYKGFQP